MMDGWVLVRSPNRQYFSHNQADWRVIMKDSVQQNSRSPPKTMVLSQGLLSEAESFFLKGKSIQILIFKMVMVILNFNILRHGPWQMHL